MNLESNRVLYFIGAEEEEDMSSRPVKIGIATDLQGRLTSIQVGHPKRLSVIASFPFATLEDERRLHKQLKEKRLVGEWFELSNEDIDELHDEWGDNSIALELFKANDERWREFYSHDQFLTWWEENRQGEVLFWVDSAHAMQILVEASK